jgi:DNA-binding Lrp family transcriptional regulator
METLFLLASTESGALREAMAKIREIPHVAEVEPVSGMFDLLVKIEAPGVREGLDIVMNRIRKISGIRQTETLISLGGISRSAGYASRVTPASSRRGGPSARGSTKGTSPPP